MVRGRHGTYQVTGKSFGRGGVGEIIALRDPDYVYKRYIDPAKAPPIRQLERLVSIGRRVLLTERKRPGDTPESSINWPVDLVLGPGATVEGVILPAIPPSLFNEHGVTRGLEFLIMARANPPSARARVAALIRMAEILAFVHGCGLVHGDVNGKNLVWTIDPEPIVYLIDCDGMVPQRPAPQAGVAALGWRDPRLIEGRIPAHDHYSDWYALALAMYRGLLLTPGNLEKRNGSWPRPAGVTNKVDSRIGQLLLRALNAPLGTTNRPDPSTWVNALLETYVSNGRYDDAALHGLDAVANTNRPSQPQPPGGTFTRLPPISTPPAPSSKRRTAQRTAPTTASPAPTPAAPSGPKTAPAAPSPPRTAQWRPRWSPSSSRPRMPADKVATATVQLAGVAAGVVILVVLAAVAGSTLRIGSMSGSSVAPALAFWPLLTRTLNGPALALAVVGVAAAITTRRQTWWLLGTVIAVAAIGYYDVVIAGGVVSSLPLPDIHRGAALAVSTPLGHRLLALAGPTPTAALAGVLVIPVLRMIVRCSRNVQSTLPTANAVGIASLVVIVLVVGNAIDIPVQPVRTAALPTPASEAQDAVVDANVMQLDSREKFNPQRPVAREDLAVALAKLLQLREARANIADDHKIEQADLVRRTVGWGIMTLNDQNRFRPRTRATREDLALSMVRIMRLPPAPWVQMADANKASDPNSIRAVTAAGLMPMNEATDFAPTRRVTRAELANTLYPLVQAQADR